MIPFADRRYLMKKQFLMLTGASEEEAGFYLDDAKWDVARATKTYKDDAASSAAVEFMKKSGVPPAAAPSFKPSIAPPKILPQDLKFRKKSSS